MTNEGYTRKPAKLPIGITALSVAAIAVGAFHPDAGQAKQTKNQNRETAALNAQARKSATFLGSQILDLYHDAKRHHIKGWKPFRFNAQPDDQPFLDTVGVTIDTHKSEVPGAGGRYVLTANVSPTSDNILHANKVMDINVTEGKSNKAYSYGLAYMNLNHLDNNWLFDGQFADKPGHYIATGGTTLPGIVRMNSTQLAHATYEMQVAITDAVIGTPTHYIEAPF